MYPRARGRSAAALQSIPGSCKTLYAFKAYMVGKAKGLTFKCSAYCSQVAGTVYSMPIPQRCEQIIFRTCKHGRAMQLIDSTRVLTVAIYSCRAIMIPYLRPNILSDASQVEPHALLHSLE